MIQITKECFSRSKDKSLKIGEKVSFTSTIEKAYIESGFAIEVKKKSIKNK